MIQFPARALTALIAALPLLPLHAQEDQGWYQVELLVVAHTDPAAQRAERWDPLPALSYPEQLRFLIDPQRLQANLDNTDRADYSEVDAQGRQRIHLQSQWPVAEGPIAGNADTLGPGAAPADGDTGAPGMVDTPPGEYAAEGERPGAEAEPAVLDEPPRLPTPFVQLPASAREFRGKAAYMERNGPYRVLFHEVWWQPIGNQRAALPLVLDRSGDTASYPPLQGTVTLYRSRFLHLETNLWLNTEGSYLPGNWRMPAPPLAPASLELVEPPLLQAELEEALEFDGMYDPSWDQIENAADEGVGAATAYPWRHAVLLQQQRRMRSSEVHYIDHPLLGVVIKLTPLTPEALQEADYDTAIRQLLQKTEPTTGSPAVF
ncbi:MAG: CsiV family protein [Haliea sp.]|uniref:CsiV family protein n=1 Tax=Haliea sp. TaxID=1932666 RepID=UPI0032EBF8B4